MGGTLQPWPSDHVLQVTVTQVSFQWIHKGFLEVMAFLAYAYKCTHNTCTITYIKCKLIIIIYHCYSLPVESLHNFTISNKVLCNVWYYSVKSWISPLVPKQWRCGIIRNLQEWRRRNNNTCIYTMCFNEQAKQYQFLPVAILCKKNYKCITQHWHRQRAHKQIYMLRLLWYDIHSVKNFIFVKRDYKA